MQMYLSWGATWHVWTAIYERANDNKQATLSKVLQKLFAATGCHTEQIVSICQVSDPKCESMNINDEKARETPPDDSASSPSVNFSLYGKGYVCLPNRSASRSTQDLLSHSNANTNTPRHDRSEQDQQNADSAEWSAQADIKPGCDEPTGSCQPPALTSGPSTGWPEGGTLQASGYFHLPAV